MADSTTIYSIAEFILRQQTISDGLANAILLALPFPSAASSSASLPRSLRRAILIRGLSSDLSKRRFSTQTLRLIELLHCMNPIPNPLASDAYLSVATYIVASAPNFVSAVASIFSSRIGDILKSPDASGLVSDRMKIVVGEMEMALTDPDLRSEILRRNTLNEALEAVRSFLEKEKEKEKEEMESQPCLLEKAAPIEIQRKSCIASKSTLTPKVEKVVQELRSSCAVLLANIEDPLPEAIKVANEVAESLRGKMGENETDILADVGIPENCKSKDGISISGEGASAGIPKQSLMDRQPTAFHYEWSETPELSSDGSEGISRRKFHLATPKRIPVSPLRLLPKRQVGVRRRFKKWTILEEETLRKAVEEFGRGNWKKMLEHYCYIFEERTEVDLKDKWRNMTRS